MVNIFFKYVRLKILQICSRLIRSLVSLLYLIHHSIRQVGLLIFAPLVHHGQTVSTDSRGDRQSTAELWCIRAFDHKYPPNTHTQHAHTHYDFPSAALSCYPSMSMIHRRIVCACVVKKTWVLTQSVSCGCMALWSIEAAVKGEKHIWLSHSVWSTTALILHWNHSSCALNISMHHASSSKQWNAPRNTKHTTDNVWTLTLTPTAPSTAFVLLHAVPHSD